MGTLQKTIGLVLFIAAGVATLGAYAGYGSVCVHYDGAEACLGRKTEFAVYLLVSIAGLAAAGLMLHFAFRGPRRAFVALLLAALVLYAASVVFADAGTHGWDNLKVVPVVG